MTVRKNVKLDFLTGSKLAECIYTRTYACRIYCTCQNNFRDRFNVWKTEGCSCVLINDGENIKGFSSSPSSLFTKWFGWTDRQIDRRHFPENMITRFERKNATSHKIHALYVIMPFPGNIWGGAAWKLISPGHKCMKKILDRKDTGTDN